MKFQSKGKPLSAIRHSISGVSLVIALVVAFFVWAGSASLTSTIQIQAVLDENRASSRIDAISSGQISKILVDDFSTVSAGQVIAIFSTEKEQIQKRHLLKKLERLNLELSDLNAALTENRLTPPGNINAKKRLLRTELENYEVKLDLLQNKSESLRARLASTVSSEASTFQKIVYAVQNKERQDALVHQGLAKEAAKEEAELAILNLREDAERLASQRVELNLELEGIGLSRRELRVERQKMLLRAINEVTEAIHQAEAELTILNALLDEKVVRSPRAGVVTNWLVKKGDYVKEGQHLGDIAQVVHANHLVVANVSPEQIDQVHVSQVGLLSFPTLPQRSMPRVSASIVARATKAEIDTSTGQKFYRVVAEIEAEGMDKIEMAVGNRHFEILGLPVMLTLEGRQGTVLDFLIGPLKATFLRAFQD